MKKEKPKDVEEYLAGVPEPACSTLRKVRAIIRSLAPAETTETIKLRDSDVQVHWTSGWFRGIFRPLQFFPDEFVTDLAV